MHIWVPILYSVALVAQWSEASYFNTVKWGVKTDSLTHSHVLMSLVGILLGYCGVKQVSVFCVDDFKVVVLHRHLRSFHCPQSIH